MELLFQKEKLTLMEKELALLINTYWFATPENIDHQRLDFNWPQYRMLEDIGACHIFTCRNTENGRMIAAAIYMVVEALHHKGYVIADCDTLCTAIECRGHGVGRKLFQFVEPKLIELGAKEITNRARLVYNTDHLFPDLGFTAIETVYSKKVG